MTHFAKDRGLIAQVGSPGQSHSISRSSHGGEKPFLRKGRASIEILLPALLKCL